MFATWTTNDHLAGVMPVDVAAALPIERYRDDGPLRVAEHTVPPWISLLGFYGRVHGSRTRESVGCGYGGPHLETSGKDGGGGGGSRHQPQCAQNPEEYVQGDVQGLRV